MTYTAENIRSLKRDGGFDDYVQMEQALVAKLANAEMVDEGDGEIRIAYMHGGYSAWENGSTGKYDCSCGTAYGPLDKEWTDFPTLNAARQYARAALRNHLTALKGEVLASTRQRLAALEAAI